MPSFNIEFDVWCACGAPLCNQTDANDRTYRNHQGRHIVVEPCTNCLKAAANEADKDGYRQGWDEAKLAAEAKNA